MGMAALLVANSNHFSNLSFPQPKEAPYEIWATILAIFHFPDPVRLQIKFEQHWPRGSRGEIWNSEHFSYTNA